jgi:hypothetical protein
MMVSMYKHFTFENKGILTFLFYQETKGRPLEKMDRLFHIDLYLLTEAKANGRKRR